MCTKLLLIFFIESDQINCILGNLRPTTGDVFHHPRLRIASFTQHHVDQLDLKKSAVDNMHRLFPGHESIEFRSHLGRFNLSGELAIKPTRKLSGGQKVSEFVYAKSCFGLGII